MSSKVRIGVRISREKVSRLCEQEGISIAQLGERLSEAGTLSQSGLYKALNEGALGGSSLGALSTYFGFDTPARVASGLLETYLLDAHDEQKELDLSVVGF